MAAISLYQKNRAAAKRLKSKKTISLSPVNFTNLAKIPRVQVNSLNVTDNNSSLNIDNDSPINAFSNLKLQTDHFHQQQVIFFIFVITS